MGQIIEVGLTHLGKKVVLEKQIFFDFYKNQLKKDFLQILQEQVLLSIPLIEY